MHETNHLRLDPVFADSLTNLHIATQVGKGVREEKIHIYLQDHPEQRAVLVDNLTRSLADVAYRIQHERHLRAMRMADVCDDAFFGDEERQSRILNGGPDTLQNSELGQAALSLHLSFWHRIITERLTPFWVEAVETAMSQAAREKGEYRMRHRDLVDQILDNPEPDEE